MTIDAQRREVDMAEYKLNSTRRQVVVPLHLTTVPALLMRAEQAPLLLVGPEVTRWAATSRVILPEAEMLGRLAIELAPSPVSGEKLEPIYLRETTFVKAPQRRSSGAQTP